MSRLHFIVDVETDGPCPGKYSMVSFGAVLLNRKLDTTFYGKLRPISDEWIPDALAISGHTRDECMCFESPEIIMKSFAEWINSLTDGKRCYFWSDNNGFDWQFINYYFHNYHGSNPFGWSSNNLSSFYKGVKKDITKNHKKLRKTRHTHNPVDDAMGNAVALLHIINNYDVNINLGD
jgi:hypothetical protein